MIISFVSPRLLLIGGGTVAKLNEVLAQFGLSRPLVVTDPWMVSSFVDEGSNGLQQVDASVT